MRSSLRRRSRIWTTTRLPLGFVDIKSIQMPVIFLLFLDHLLSGKELKLPPRSS